MAWAPLRKLKALKRRSATPTLPSRTYGFVRARELEGSYPGPPNVGTWLTSTMRIAKGWGRAPDDAWPYEPWDWPPLEPPGVDAIAKPNRSTAYTRCRTLEDCRIVLGNGGGVLAAFQIDESWRSSDGVIADPCGLTPAATHSIMLLEHDDQAERFRFLHNWGPSWGDEGFGYLPYRYWEERLLEAWVPDSRDVVEVATKGRNGTIVINRDAPHWRGGVVRMIEIEDLDRDELAGWAILTEAPGSLELEELFVRPAYRGAGHGSSLALGVAQLRARRGLPLNVWIPHVDWPLSSEGKSALARLGLAVAECPERWAAARGITSS